MITVRVKFFAALRDLAGREEKILVLPNASRASKVIDVLSVEYVKMKDWKGHLRVAVNLEYVPMDYTLHDQDEVALIPPVSGG